MQCRCCTGLFEWHGCGAWLSCSSFHVFGTVPDDVGLGLQATRLARAMVTRYGMSDVLGKVSINYDDMGQSLSSETRAAVEGEVRFDTIPVD